MKDIPVILFGAGGVGSALIRQIINGRSRVAERNHCQFNVVAVTDSKTWLWNADGLTDEQLLDVVAAKAEKQVVDPAFRHEPLTSRKRPSDIDVVNAAAAAGLSNVILVDVTAADGMEPTLMRALELGYGIVLANKKAFAGPLESALPFFNNLQVRHESTVGGGQPVIATLRYLLDVNDPIYQIEGQLSGTLGFICQQLDRGVSFSQAVREAKERGYTEPDPREDLGGMDVMRKVMILGRMAGWPLTNDDITVESLYTPELASSSVDEFMTEVATLDDKMAQRFAEAKANGNVLRYVAEVEEGKGIVGLKPISADSALANLKYISFRTERYNDEALLIGGKGAGVEMTAAGVLGDMLDLVRETA